MCREIVGILFQAAVAAGGPLGALPQLPSSWPSSGLAKGDLQVGAKMEAQMSLLITGILKAWWQMERVHTKFCALLRVAADCDKLNASDTHWLCCQVLRCVWAHAVLRMHVHVGG